MRSTTPPQTTPAPGQLRSIDRELLEALRTGEQLGVTDLTRILRVTATAVRQRIDRLLEDGLIARHKVVSGRGRPTFNYSLTVQGHRQAGADHAELADALWQELLAIQDPGLRLRLISGVARRLGKLYAAKLAHEVDQSTPLEVRMHELSRLLHLNRIPVEVVSPPQTDLPVLGVNACPYPELTDPSERRSMCRLEAQMLSEALGQHMHLTRCRLDGDGYCEFSPAGTGTGTG